VESVDRIVAWSRTHEGRKLIRFTSASVISTIISNVALAILYGSRAIDNELWATLAGNLIAVPPSYFLTRNWAWQKRGRSHFLREVVPFWSLALAGIAFSQLGAWWARNEVHSHSWGHVTNTALVVGANIVSFVIFWVLKLLLFNRIFRVHPLDAIDARLTLEEGQPLA
jgi:putative flippase GtrA